MGLAIERRTVYVFFCDEDGRLTHCNDRCHKEAPPKVDDKAPKEHHFIILSDLTYNKASKYFVLGVPISTQKTNFKMGADAESISPEDFEEPEKYPKTSGVYLPDKVCRLNLSCIKPDTKNPTSFGRLKEQAYKKIVKKVFFRMGGAGADVCPSCGASLVNAFEPNSG